LDQWRIDGSTVEVQIAGGIALESNVDLGRSEVTTATKQ
jgi:hypothetical protein